MKNLLNTSTLILIIGSYQLCNAQNIINTGLIGSNEGIGFNLQYFYQFNIFRAGFEIGKESEFLANMFGYVTPNEGRFYVGPTMGVGRILKYGYISIDIGAHYSSFTRRGELIESNCTSLFNCDSEYQKLKHNGIGIPLFLDFGLKIKKIGLGSGIGYEINTYKSLIKVHLIKLRIGG